MFKSAVILRNIALFASLALAFTSAGKAMELSIAGAISSGVALLVIQYIVSGIGAKMMNNNKNQNASPLKKALVASGFSVAGSITEKVIKDKYHGAASKVFLFAPVAALALCATQFALGTESYWLLGLLISASFFLAMQPIYMALQKEESIA
ncbi:hypothetical protein REH81_19645 [Vibrio rotiferianus]